MESSEKVAPPVRAPSKRGLGWPWDNTAAEFSLYAPAIGSHKLSWLFNWEMWKPQGFPPSLEYVPQVRTAAEAGQIDQYLNTINGHFTHFIGFNEPDHHTQANLPAGTAAQLWRQHVLPAKNKFHFRLGSPAITSAPTGKKWLQDFLKDLGGEESAGIDFVVVHWYGTDVHQLESFLADIHATFNKPLWLTEFAYSRLTAAPPAPTTQQVEAFMRESIPRLEKLPYLEKYSYFGAPTDVGAWVGRASNFTDKGHSLTSVGKLYCDL